MSDEIPGLGGEPRVVLLGIIETDGDEQLKSLVFHGDAAATVSAIAVMLREEISGFGGRGYLMHYGSDGRLDWWVTLEEASDVIAKA